jgi:clan AA aspartic protease (TIGR02281 family)
MTRVTRALGLAAVILAAAGGARGEIYRWTDAEGRLHAAGRIDQVPPQYRNAARENAITSRPAAPADPEPAVPAAATPAPTARTRGLRREIEIPFTKIGTLMRVDATVNDAVSVPFLIDTGASGVSIPTSYAEKLGVRVRSDTPRVAVTTANGIVARPLVPLSSIEIRGARVEHLSATLDPGLEFGLLGGSFFNNYIYRVDAARSVMTLVPNDESAARSRKALAQSSTLDGPLHRPRLSATIPTSGAGARGALGPAGTAGGGLGRAGPARR